MLIMKTASSLLVHQPNCNKIFKETLRAIAEETFTLACTVECRPL